MTIGSQTTPPTNESYEVKRVQLLTAACLAGLMHQLGGRAIPWRAGAWNLANVRSIAHGDRWRKNYQHVDFHYDHHDGRKSEGISFSDVFYGPTTAFVEGTPVLLENVELRVDAQSKVFDNSRGATPYHVAFEQEVALERSVSSHIASTFTLDVTETAEVTAGAEFPGGSVEAKFGLETHQGWAEEKAKDEAENKSTSDTVALEFDVAPGAITLLEVIKDHQRERVPRRGVFEIDFALILHFAHWRGDAHGSHYRRHGLEDIKLQGLADLMQFVRGTNTAYPEMAGFWEDSRACPIRVKNGINHIMAPANRSYYLDVPKERVFEKNADYRLTSLDSASHEAAAGVQVVDVSDEEDRRLSVGPA